mgnify:CR=1 FL=1
MPYIDKIGKEKIKELFFRVLEKSYQLHQEGYHVLISNRYINTENNLWEMAILATKDEEEAKKLQWEDGKEDNKKQIWLKLNPNNKIGDEMSDDYPVYFADNKINSNKIKKEIIILENNNEAVLFIDCLNVKIKNQKNFYKEFLIWKDQIFFSQIRDIFLAPTLRVLAKEYVDTYQESKEVTEQIKKRNKE